jgi:hypothetical protein
MSRKKSRPQKPRVHTIRADVLDKLRVLSEGLTFLRDSEGPDTYILTLKRLGVTKGFPYDEARRLSSLVGRLYAAGDTVKWLEPQKRERRVWLRDGNARIRTLRSKMTKAQVAIRSVRAHLNKISVPLEGATEHAFDYLDNALEPLSPHDAEPLLSVMKATEPDGQAIGALFDFFTNEWSLPKDEAEIRTAQIGNHLWGWNFTVIERLKPKSDLRRGCEAVRKAVDRRKHRRDRSPRIC